MDIPKVVGIVVERDFGVFVELVASELVSSGGCTERELVKRLEEKDGGGQVQRALMTLARNGLVHKDDGGKFRADVSTINLRWRFPYFSVMVAEEFGEEAQLVVELLLVHGKVTSKQLFTDERVGSGRISALETLISNRVLEPEKLAAFETSEHPPAKRMRSSTEVPKTLSIKINSREEALIPIPDKTDSDTTWKLRLSQFHLMACNKICTDLVRQTIDVQAGAVVEAVLKKTLLKEESISSSSFQSVSEATIVQDLKDSGTSVDRSALDGKIELMCRPDIGYLRRFGDQLHAEVTTMLNIVRRKTAEEIILKRFGPEARRMFSLLMHKKKLEAKHAAELSMLNQRKAREMLFKLHDAGYATVQEVPRTSDFKQSKCIYIWSVNLPEAYKRIAQHIDRSCLNLYRRLKTMEEEPREKQDADFRRKQKEFIEVSILRLQINLMLFRDLK
ncbi:hypothetical protein NDN08_003352 [Rhodosorus marinus]|uniref:DNA-directed RNA polymerase III subunit RPC3 n=1 Tax=Rhodosorus marinus TaxID=101924 RepID=A0AAV8UZ23_9RHOD|nr:hypothetical protein NDN08_003352 [Rhodosorus marinus]